MKLTKFVEVQTMTTNGGNPTGNQVILSEPDGDMFVSYGTKICWKSKSMYNGYPKIILDEYYWDYSRTTSKYRNEFLGMSTPQLKELINQGIVKFTELN